MNPSLRYPLAGLFLSPALALADAPIVPLEPPVAVVRGQAPAAPPMVMPAPGGAAPIVAAPAAPAPALAAPAVEPAAAPEEEAAPPERWFLEKTLAGIPAFKTLGENGWRIYGWTQGSYNVSTANRSNLPVPFIDRADTFSLMQNWLHVEKTIDTSKKEYQVGGAVDVIMPGTDTRLTLSRGMFDGQNRRGVLYGFDVFQAYVDLFSPNVGPQGTTFRVGKFATHCEYEVVQGISNPFLSRSYLFQYNPFTHTGVNAITPLNDNWTMANGIVLGSDNFIDPASRVTYIGQLKWAPKDGKTSILFNAVVTNPSFDVAEAFAFYNVYNLQLTHKFTDKLTYVMDGTVSHITNVPGIGNADWYGFAHYLLYQATDKLAVNTRVELFNDTQGFRTGFSGLYTEVTTGLTWKPQPWLYVMPEVRYDHHNGGVGPFEGDRDLFTAAIGFIVRW
jgi:hypothetical protein